MKKGCLLVGAVAVVLFVAVIVVFGVLLHVLAGNTEDQSDLTEHIAAKVVASRDFGDGYGVIYSYEADGRTYYGRDTITTSIGGWTPRDGLSVCVDPHNRARHAIGNGHACGDPELWTSTEKGRTTRPSW